MRGIWFEVARFPGGKVGIDRFHSFTAGAATSLHLDCARVGTGLNGNQRIESSVRIVWPDAAQ